ncbi:MAG: hypothetical protein CVU40_12695 [Chloroflexi bacterium HGW-Chloroflexi-2]|jgi:hypothetical protein|nr:MAG: hypothetical protein CVU40_12695 [Chloroflexi bacterium HGW-Chloroflexi-2]
MDAYTAKVLFIGLIVILPIVWVLYISKKGQVTSNANANKILDKLEERNFKSHKDYYFGIPESKFRYISFDLNRKEIAIADAHKNTLKFINFNQIIDCEIIEDNTTIMKGGVGSAIIGGMLAEGDGAIVGAGTRSTSGIVKNLALRIITKDISDSMVMFTAINFDIKRDHIIYINNMESAQGVYSTIISIINSGKTENQSNSVDTGKLNNVVRVVGSKISESLSDQIKELAKLKDEGLITEEEFTKKKKRILNID